MPDLQDGESVEIKGSAAKSYILKNIGDVFSCTCPAWRNQSLGIERRTTPRAGAPQRRFDLRQRAGQNGGASLKHAHY